MNTVIQSLWIGSELSTMEQLCINSFLQNGHEFHLYCYEDVQNVPDGTLVKDARDILPKEDVFSYKVGPGKGSYSAFSNYFRYKLLHIKGGWWVDTDIICLKHFDFEDEYVFSSELTHTDEIHTTSSVIKAPIGNQLCDYCYKICEEQNKDELGWGTVGPVLVKNAVEFFKMEDKIQEYHVFCPIGYAYSNIIVQPDIHLTFPDETYAVHLWNEMWRRQNIGKDVKYSDTSIYEKLKKRYGV